MELTWTPALKIGHDEIDRQHVELFGLFDAFVEGCASGRGKETLIKLHKSLKEYAVSHFRDEEALMLKSGYPGIEQHKREHRKFQRDIQELNGKIGAQGITLIDLVQTNKVLVNWLVNHVRDTDQKFGVFLSEAAAGE